MNKRLSKPLYFAKSKNFLKGLTGNIWYRDFFRFHLAPYKTYKTNKTYKTYKTFQRCMITESERKIDV